MRAFLALFSPLILLLFAIHFVPPLSAQEILIAGAEGDKTCGLTTTPAGVVNKNGGPTLFTGPPAAAVQRRDGGFVLSVTGVGLPLFELSSDFRLLRELPLPLSGVNRIASLAGDSIAVLDQGVGELIVIDPALREARRGKMSIGASDQLMRIGQNGLVSNASVPYPAYVGFPLHVFDPEGAHLRSFGSNGAYRVGADASLMRALSSSKRGFLAGHVDQYRVEEWSAGGEPGRVVVRKVPWFPGGPLSLPSPETPPSSFLSAIREREDGTVSVAIHVPDKDWSTKTVFLTRSNPGGREVTVPESINTLWATRVELLDLSMASLIGCELLPASIIGFVTDDLLLGRRMVQGGWVVEFWRVDFQD